MWRRLITMEERKKLALIGKATVKVSYFWLSIKSTERCPTKMEMARMTRTAYRDVCQQSLLTNQMSADTRDCFNIIILLSVREKKMRSE